MRILTLLALFAFGIPAHAAWERFEVKDVSRTYYYDMASLERQGEFRRIWSLQDLRQPDAGGANSRLLHWEYDCARQLIRGLKGSGHAGAMGEGKIVYQSDKPTEWRRIASDTRGDGMMRRLCN